MWWKKSILAYLVPKNWNLHTKPISRHTLIFCAGSAYKIHTFHLPYVWLNHFTSRIWSIALKKIVSKSFEEQGLIGVCAKFQLYQSCQSCFFYHKYHTLDKYLTEIFFPWIFGQFFTCPNQLRMVSIKIEQNLGLYFL